MCVRIIGPHSGWQLVRSLNVFCVFGPYRVNPPREPKYVTRTRSWAPVFGSAVISMAFTYTDTFVQPFQVFF